METQKVTQFVRDHWTDSEFTTGVFPTSTNFDEAVAHLAQEAEVSENAVRDAVEKGQIHFLDDVPVSDIEIDGGRFRTATGVFTVHADERELYDYDVERYGLEDALFNVKRDGDRILLEVGRQEYEESAPRR